MAKLIKALLLLMFTLFVVHFCRCQTILPGDVNGLELWLKADSNIVITSSSFIWSDVRNNGTFVEQDNFLAQPAINISDVINETEVLIFDGIDDYLNLNNSINVGTIIILANDTRENTSGVAGLITGKNPIQSNNLITTTPNSTFLWGSGFFGNNFFINDMPTRDFSPLSEYKVIQTYAVSAPLELSDGLQIGKDRQSNVRFWKGGIAEILIYSSILTTDQLSELRQYFYSRYGNKVDLGADINVENFCSVEITSNLPFRQYQWSDGSTDSVITVSSTKKVILTAEDEFGRISSDTIQVTFPGNFIQPFTLCAGSDSLYDPGLDAFDITWQDGSTGPDYLIDGPGTYYLTVNDTSGCSYSDTIQVAQDAFPLNTAIAYTTPFCLGNELYLSSGFAEAETYLWSTGEDTPFIHPQTSGQYWVEATNANGCVGRDTIDVNIVGTAPTVDFITGTACEDNAVVFTDGTFPEGATITGQDWSFNNGQSTAQGGQVENVFPATGSYPVELTVTLDNGCSGTKRDTVTVHPLPLVGFNYDQVTPCAGNEVAFESQSGVPGNGTIASWGWTFDNGTTDTGFVGSTTFTTLGVHAVTHRVTTTAGCTDSLTANVVVLGSPAADFTFDTVCLGMPTVFNQQVDTSVSGSVFYNWQFGDGYFSNFPNTSHQYAAAGVYTVTLTATGNDFGNAGCVDAATRQVRVYAPPQAVLSTEDGCKGSPLALTDLTSPTVLAGEADPVETRVWKLPYGYGQGPVLLGGDSLQYWYPEEDGDYVVSLGITTAAGCTGSASGTAGVFEIPEADFSLSIPDEAPPLTVHPANLSSGAAEFTWLINGEVAASGFEPEFLFPDTGVYTVSLVAINGPGCSDTLTREVHIIEPVYDLGLVDIRYTVSGGKLSLGLLLSNRGNTAVTTFRASIRLGMSGELTSEEVFALQPGEVREYALPRKFTYLEGRDLPYVCVDVVLTKEGVIVAESDTTNNGMCVGLEKEKAVVIDPWPNPTESLVYLGFVLPADGDVLLDISDAAGRKAGHYRFVLKQGYSKIDMDLSGLLRGVYVFRYTIGGEVFTRKVVLEE